VPSLLKSRSFRQRIRRGAAVAAPVLAYIGLSSWAASIRLGAIMDSTREREEDELSADPFNVDFRGDPGKAFGYPFEDVLIPTDLGDAPAWFVPGTGAIWAIFVHGIGAVRENGLRHLSVYHAAGIPTLLITYRNDEGAPQDPSARYAFGLTEWRDLEAAVDYAVAQGAERVILDGESMGGAIVGEFLRESSRVNRVAAIVLDSPALDLHAIGRNYIRLANAPLPGVVSTVGLWLTGRRFGIPISTARSVDVVSGFQGPIFLAHGEDDTVVPIESTDALLSTRQGATTLLRTRAGHIMSWEEDPERYRTWLHSFLMTVLEDASPPPAWTGGGAAD
jgi:uncharacterized protein